MNNNKYFKTKDLRVLVLLIILDLIATLLWYNFYGIEEANPLLDEHIKESSLRFSLLKLGLSIPGVYFLWKYIGNRLAQIGIGLLLLVYIFVGILHIIIFCTIVLQNI